MPSAGIVSPGLIKMTSSNLSFLAEMISSSPPLSKRAAAGKTTFAMCAGCHGADAKGSFAHNLPMGAADLTDKVWLYGGSTRAVEETIAKGRAGVMPAWKEILGEDKVHLISAYVYSLSQK